MRWLRPIPEDWIERHFALFIVILTPGIVLLLLEELPAHPHGDIVGFINAMIRGMTTVFIFAAASSTIIVEGTLILAERYLKHRYNRGKDEGVDEERQRWLEWLERKQSAEASGVEFSEPSPAETHKGNNGHPV